MSAEATIRVNIPALNPAPKINRGANGSTFARCSPCRTPTPNRRGLRTRDARRWQMSLSQNPSMRQTKYGPKMRAYTACTSVSCAPIILQREGPLEREGLLRALLEEEVGISGDVDPVSGAPTWLHRARDALLE